MLVAAVQSAARNRALSGSWALKCFAWRSWFRCSVYGCANSELQRLLMLFASAWLRTGSPKLEGVAGSDHHSRRLPLGMSWDQGSKVTASWSSNQERTTASETLLSPGPRL